MHQRHNTFRAHAHRHKPEVWGDAPDKPNSLSTTTARAALTLPSRAANHYTIQASRGQAKVGSANLRANCRKTAATTKSNTWACNSRIRLDAACSLPREPPSSEHAFPVAMFVWSLKPRCQVLCPRRNLRGKNTATHTSLCLELRRCLERLPGILTMTWTNHCMGQNFTADAQRSNSRSNTNVQAHWASERLRPRMTCVSHTFMP